MDVFFVISGYLITGIVASGIAAGTFSIVEFYERRARRILPALFLVLAASVVAAWWLLLPKALVDQALLRARSRSASHAPAQNKH